MAWTRSGSRIKAEPDARPITFFAGHPILISMRFTPSCSAIRAASAIIFGSQPAICSPTGASLCKLDAIFFISVRTLVSMAWLATISLITKPPPARRTAARNGLSVIPDIGAKTTSAMLFSPERPKIWSRTYLMPGSMPQGQPSCPELCLKIRHN